MKLKSNGTKRGRARIIKTHDMHAELQHSSNIDCGTCFSSRETGRAKPVLLRWWHRGHRQPNIQRRSTEHQSTTRNSKARNIKARHETAKKHSNHTHNFFCTRGAPSRGHIDKTIRRSKTGASAHTKRCCVAVIKQNKEKPLFVKTPRGYQTQNEKKEKNTNRGRTVSRLVSRPSHSL